MLQVITLTDWVLEVWFFPRSAPPQWRRCRSFSSSSSHRTHAWRPRGPGSVVASSSVRGVICQDKPHLSLHHPQALSLPPLLTIALQYWPHLRWVNHKQAFAQETAGNYLRSPKANQVAAYMARLDGDDAWRAIFAEGVSAGS